MSGILEKKLIVNWRFDEGSGGQETFFNYLSSILKAKKVSFSSANKVFGGVNVSGLKVLRIGYIIDKYLEYYEKLFNLSLIIKNSAIGGFLDLKTPQIVVFQDPFYSILKFLMRYEIFFEHYLSCIELMRRTGEKSLVNVAVSNFMKKEMSELKIKCDKVIEEGVDVNRFKPREDKQILKKIHNLPLNKKIGIAVTKFLPQKGWDMLIKLIHEFKDIHWIIVLTEKLNSKTKLKNVTLIEEALPDIMPRIYNCADFFINTSPIESFSLSTCEAASCNLPIIFYKTGFAWDWWDKRLGVRVKEWSFEKFKDAIKEVCENEYSPRSAIIDRGFTLERMEMEWKQFIEKLINKK